MRLNAQARSSLFPLLMKLEWVLLGTVAIAQLWVAITHATPILLVINGSGLLLFSMLKLITPRSAISKFSYTFVEFGLIFWLSVVEMIPLPSLLFIVLVIRNCLLLEGSNRSIVTGLAFLGCLLSQTHRLIHQSLMLRVPLDQLGTVWVGFILVFGLVILFLHLLVDAALKEYRGQQQLAAANLQLRQYALRVEELATVQERNRIARDIHDSLGHSLTVFGIHLEAALRLLHMNPAEAETLLREVKQLNSTTLKEVRQSIAALRSDPLQEKPLIDAISDLVAEFARSTGVVPNYEFHLRHPSNHELNVTVYRIVQESLTNIRKYAAATVVKVSIVEYVSQLQVNIYDDGKGFELSQNTTGFGHQGMQERTLALSGQLEILTSPNRGCTIKAIFPLSTHTPEAA